MVYHVPMNEYQEPSDDDSWPEAIESICDMIEGAAVAIEEDDDPITGQAMATIALAVATAEQVIAIREQTALMRAALPTPSPARQQAPSFHPLFG